MNVYEALEALEELNKSEELLQSTPSIVLFPPNDNGNDSEEDDGDDMNGIPDNLSRNQLLATAEVHLDSQDDCEQVYYNMQKYFFVSSYIRQLFFISDRYTYCFIFSSFMI